MNKADHVTHEQRKIKLMKNGYKTAMGNSTNKFF